MNVIVEGTDLAWLVRRLNSLSKEGRLRTLTIDQRVTGVAFKVNEEMWTPTCGRPRD